MERIPSVPSAENSSIAKHRKKTNAVSRPGLLLVGLSISFPGAVAEYCFYTSLSGEYSTINFTVGAGK